MQVGLRLVLLSLEKLQSVLRRFQQHIPSAWIAIQLQALSYGLGSLSLRCPCRDRPYK
ncbi:MAG: Uncharacterised protein [Prochlorococcus marinus str. MIT 9313]|nr:MAG: Uncharacterised protein [Prochlorococcus marinus str. MIT 9313]